jgi:hypothetical protein
VVKAVVTGINAAATDYVPYAQLATTQLLQTVPFGKYHNRSSQDGQDKFVDQKPVSDADKPSDSVVK